MDVIGFILGLIFFAIMVAIGALAGDYYNSYVIAASIPVMVSTFIGLALKD